MFMNRKIKSAVAIASAVVMLLANTITSVAAPFGYNSIEDIRAKALGKYLSSNTVISMAGPSDSDAEDGAVSDKFTGFREIEETADINFNTVKRLNGSLGAGEVVTVREGQNGEKTVTYKVEYKDGEEVSRELIGETVTKAPVDKVVDYGDSSVSGAAPSSKAPLDYKYVLTCEATAYDLSPEENGGYAGQSATGVPLDKGVIAVDPRVIPLGSRVYIEALDGSWSYGFAVAADTGGAIKGNRVDLCYRTRSECIQFGRRKCRVYVLN